MQNAGRLSLGKGGGSQNKLKTMKIEMNIKFEKEIMVKKEIYECDMRNEDLAFKLFSKQLILSKNKNKGNALPQVELEVTKLKEEIDSTT